MPWGRVDDTYYDHPKLDRLHGSSEWPDRLAAAGLNALAWSWCNRFLTDGHVPTAALARLGGTRDLADLLVGAGLWEEAPGGYQIHDFLTYNDSREQVMARREKEAKRKADWRAGRRSDTDVPSSVPAGHAGPNGTARSHVQDVPSSVPAGHADEMSLRDSGARARSANPDPTRPDPTRPTESLPRESRATRSRPDVQALHDRGWKRVTAKQRSVLDEVLARHDVTGPAFAAEVIRATPPDVDPLAAVMDADRLWQASQRSRADAEEEAWAAVKAAEREPSQLASVLRKAAALAPAVSDDDAEALL